MEKEVKVIKDCSLMGGYLTDEEEDALAMLRKLKEESHKIKDKIREFEKTLELASQQQSKSAFHKVREGLDRDLWVCFQQLEKLRSDWKEWETRREAANRRKMALLGYSP
jgi:phage shock protein A